MTKDHLLRKVEETIERLFGSAREKGKALIEDKVGLTLYV